MSLGANLRAAAGRAKTVDDRLLNRLGIQVARTIAARSRFALRPRPTATTPQVDAWLRRLRAEGCLAVPGFFEGDGLAALQHAAQACLNGAAPVVERSQGGVRVDVVWRIDTPGHLAAVLDRFFTDPRLVELMSAAERIEVVPGAGRCHIQRTTQLGGEPDDQAEVHIDTFHPTHKAWLYLTDVSEVDGPLVYFPGSSRLSRAGLAGVYRESVGANQASRRIPEAEIGRRGLTPRSFCVAAGTLVVADTSGYHGRFQGTPPGTRTALHLQVRPSPFRRPRRLEVDKPSVVDEAPPLTGCSPSRSTAASAQHETGDRGGGGHVEGVDLAVERDPDEAPDMGHGLRSEALALGAEDKGDSIVGGEADIVDRLGRRVWGQGQQ